MVKSPGRCSHRCGRVTLHGKVIWARAREKGYHLKFYLHFISPLLPHHWCRVAALLSKPLETTVVVESPGRCSHRAGRVTWQGLMRGTPLDHRCGRVAKPALERRRVQWHCPRAPTLEPGKGHRPKNRHSSKAKRVSALVSCLIPVLACLCRGFPGSGSLVLRPCPFGFLFVFCSASCFFLLAAGVTFQLPAGGTSGQARTGTGRRPNNQLFQVPSMYDFLAYLVGLTCSFPCTLLFIFRVCFGHCSGYPRHRQLRTRKEFRG